MKELELAMVGSIYLIFMPCMAKWVVHKQAQWMQELEFAIAMVVV